MDHKNKRNIANGIFQGANRVRSDAIDDLPESPPWRQFSQDSKLDRGKDYQASQQEIDMINVALCLRRPLLVTGKPGAGKSSLAHAVAYELALGEVLEWPITSKSTLQDGLYSYDAIGRLQDASMSGDDQPPPDIGPYIRLGPLGTAFYGHLPNGARHGETQPPEERYEDKKPKPRVLLIDELDKSDIDLPNDLLNIFEEGKFLIPELARTRPQAKDTSHHHEVNVFCHDGDNTAKIKDGLVHCQVFPLVIMTSNGEREFPPAFLRRCLRLTVEYPDLKRLKMIVSKRLGLNLVNDDKSDPKFDSWIEDDNKFGSWIKKFLAARDDDGKLLATDQLLNAAYLVKNDIADKNIILRDILRALEDA